MDASCDDGLSWRSQARLGHGTSLKTCRILARFQVEVQDRSSGLDRSPQQAEFLTAADNKFCY